MTIELEATESGSPIPLEAGVYPAKVSGVEEAEGGQFGDQVKLLLLTDEPADDGEPIELWAWASRKLSTRSKLWKWVTAITGSMPEVGKTFKIEGLLIGKPCRVQISEERLDDGSTRKKVSEILAPSKRPEKVKETEGGDPRCSECFGPLGTEGYFTAAGEPYCGMHGPRATTQG